MNNNEVYEAALKVINESLTRCTNKFTSDKWGDCSVEIMEGSIVVCFSVNNIGYTCQLNSSGNMLYTEQILNQ